MNPITRYAGFDRGLNDAFNGMFLRPVRLDADALPDQQIKLDVAESAAAYQVSAAMPGVKKDDIKVSVDGNVVRISAEAKKETDEKSGDQVLRSERYYGLLERSFSLESDIDEGRVEAKYADGVLKLMLPKKAAGAARRIAIG